LSLLGPNILLSTLFSNTLSLCSSLSVRDQVWHPYKMRNLRYTERPVLQPIHSEKRKHV
jgi:hypothetical protein